jgi:hypothetical protein
MLQLKGRVKTGQIVVRLFLRPKVLRVLGPRYVKGNGRPHGWVLAQPKSLKTIAWENTAALRNPFLWARFRTVADARRWMKSMRRHHERKVTIATADLQFWTPSRTARPTPAARP